MTEGKAKLPFWLEGDDRFTIDGQLAIHGTGSEDYFNCGWYALEGRLDRPAAYPLHGFPVYRNRDGTWQAAAYRWHLADPVTFSRSIDAGIEHGGENTTSRRLPRGRVLVLRTARFVANGSVAANQVGTLPHRLQHPGGPPGSPPTVEAEKWVDRLFVDRRVLGNVDKAVA